MNTNIPILMYHSVSETAAPRFRRWTIHPDMFAAQLEYMRNQGYTPLTVTELVKLTSSPFNKLPEKVVVITFDDGFADFYTNALPILSTYSFPATIYITTGYVGASSRWLQPLGEGNRRMLTWAQVREVDAAGMECGSHSENHHQLDTLNSDEADVEIRHSKEILEQHLGKEVTSFAYPHGYHSREIRRLVIKAGYQSACAVKHGMSSRLDDPFALARIIVSRNTDVQRLGQLLAGEGLEPVPNGEPFRTRGWRLARRVYWWLSHFQLAGKSEEESGKTYGG